MSTHLRNSNINYRDGWFFVTSQVAKNKSLLGVVSENKVLLNALGRKVQDEWLRLGREVPGCELGAFIVMPNHFHGLVRVFPTQKGPSVSLSDLLHLFKGRAAHDYLLARKAGEIPDIGTKLWQASFYDELSDDSKALAAMDRYVRDNPLNWDNDRFGPVTTFTEGDIGLLNAPGIVAFVASAVPCTREPPVQAVGAPIISTFTSPQERAVLRRCIALGRPFIAVFPGGIPPVPPEVRAAITSGKALVMSPVAPGTGVNKQRAIWCNRYVLKTAATIRRGTIQPGGTLEPLLFPGNKSRGHN